MNHFLALRLADSTRSRLAALAERLQAWDIPARWVHPDDYHLTVCFLGPLDQTVAHAIGWSINDVAESLTTPDLQLPGLGAFAGRSEPRIVFAAVADAGRYCLDLHGDLQDALGERPEANYRPHITLCRPRPNKAIGGRRWSDLIEAHGLADWGACEVTDLVLYRSDPNGGRRYRALESWPVPRQHYGAA